MFIRKVKNRKHRQNTYRYFKYQFFLLQGKADILVLTESKLDSFFQRTNFLLKFILSPLDLIETGTEMVFFNTSGKIYYAMKENCRGIDTALKGYLLQSI